MSRIITGSARGSRLATLPGDTTRPTTDRVREALFSSLADWAGTIGADPAAQFEGLAVVDLFAGSGALGLEAASRGAEPVTLVERDRAAVRVIRQNLKSTGLGGQVLATTAESHAATAPARAADVILMDPPYALPNTELSVLLATLLANGHLVSDGIIVIERSSRDAVPEWPDGLELGWTRRYGESCLYFCRPLEGKKDA